MTLSKSLILTAFIGLLAACGNDTSRPDIGASTLVNVAKGVVGREETPASPTAAQLREAITPEFRAQSGNKPLIIATSLRVPVSSIMTMFAQNGDVRTYLSPDVISFSLRNGVVIASRGLGFDLMSADVSGVLPRVRAGSGRAVRVHRYLDGENQEVLRSFVCDFSTVAPRTVVEDCKSPDIEFQNRYVLDGAGNIAVSEQWISPKLQSYRIEEIR